MKLKSFSPNTSKQEIFFSSKTLTSLPKLSVSSRGRTSVLNQLSRSCGGRHQRQQLRPTHVRVHVGRSLSHPLEICHPVWLVRKYSKVNSAWCRIVWRRLNVERNSKFFATVEKFIMNNIEKSYNISFAKLTAQQSMIYSPSTAEKGTE